jgi:hypothetical protein
MSGPSRSFDKVNYLLRPSKQVERKLFIEALHCLGQAGYKISKYTYVGLGSVFYADFILFHKYLYIDNMICAEEADIPKRMRFNRPFGFIRLRMHPVIDLLPSLSRKKPYLVWLDYDKGLDLDILHDVNGFAGKIHHGSVLIITVDAEPELQDREENERLSRRERCRRLCQLYNAQFSKYLSRPLRPRDISKADLPRIFAQILRSQLTESVTKRGLHFFQIFNFKYADNAQMLSIGGVIANDIDREKIMESGIDDLEYTEQGEEPRLISVPPLTLREKQWIDNKIKKKSSFSYTNFGLEIERTLLENYIKYYRHYPNFHESLL